MTMRFCLENEMLDEDMKLFMRALGEDDELIGERLRVLSGVLNELDY